MDNLQDDLIEQTFLDRDFKDRTLFQVITSNNLHSFISSGKVNFLLDSVWEGMHMADWDGSLYDFSLLTYLAASDVIYIPGK